MKKKNRILLAALLLLAAIILYFAQGALFSADSPSSMVSPQHAESVQQPEQQAGETPEPARDGVYSSKEEVALYLHLYGELPQNFITKAEAKELGWDSGEGNLWEVAEGMSIGGDRFGNREGLLPESKGRSWYECDVNYSGGFRGAERILYSSDGLIYYTNDHYKSFTQLY